MTSLIQIGNSKGIRIPKHLITQARLENTELELVVVEEGLLLKPVQKLRSGWEEATKRGVGSAEDNSDAIMRDFEAVDCENDWEW